ncbi:hypothetical protein PESP_a2219 [Pseudoalteromonas espejiana DSM 9414]|uniref:DNA-binding protein n=1 Tax=Pseudoalteromonas espejiana TaxID=28107 RepID=A0A510XSH5_9GAMM|nr:hypothetical protein [Pseudoalteromonas espejiana]ASM50219.1 hypothetical protein PESP_a2219 [Pseudoalteromonas espejiana DSM 9414]GEK53969.1 hypothetical protein PES01_08140 [Pseudoalteromonas espejiana]
MIKNEFTLLSAKELSAFIKFSPDYINRKLKDNVFFEGKHYIRPFGSRKIFYLLETVMEEMYDTAAKAKRELIIPLANGGVCYG